MTLKRLLKGVATVESAVDLTGLVLDSRQVRPGVAFVALAGARQHGLLYVDEAIASGAVAVIYEPAGAGALPGVALNSVPFVAISDLGQKLGLLASRFYNEPSCQITVIGITGTNGKTSCSQFLGQALAASGIIGTLGWGRFGQLRETSNTTPDALALHAMLAEFVATGKKTAVMEVSSHGLAQGRVAGVRFKGAVFTNISHDHLDYHGSMDDYVQAKLGLLQTPGLAFTVVNLDDAYSARILAAIPAGVAVWGASSTGRVLPQGETVAVGNIEQKLDGTCFDVSWQGNIRPVYVPLYGDFNVENASIVLTVLLATGMSFDAAVNKLALLQPVPGRMEFFGGVNAPLIFVDYAHTPDALEKVLAGLRRHCQARLWVVFGCGGNRDVGKRPQMGRIAEQWADRVIITDDNPRYEAAADIIAAIRTGCRTDKVITISDRETAIKTAISEAGVQDCVVIAGKGHEQYQEIQGIKMPFSDQDVVRQTLAMRVL